MAQPVVDIRVLGSEALSKAMAALPARVQKKLVRSSLRDSAKRHRSYVVRQSLALRGRTQRSGRERLLQLAEYFETADVRSAGNRKLIRVGLTFPSRDELGVDAKDKNYWPSAIEYGSPAHGIPAHPYMRPAVDENKTTELTILARDIGDDIETEMQKALPKGTPT